MRPWSLGLEHGQLLPKGKILESKLGTAEAQRAKRPHDELSNTDERLTDHLYLSPAILRVVPDLCQPGSQQNSHHEAISLQPEGPRILNRLARRSFDEGQLELECHERSRI